MELEAGIICRAYEPDKTVGLNIAKAFLGRRGVHRFPTTLKGLILILALRKIKRVPSAFDLVMTNEGGKEMFRLPMTVKERPLDPIGRSIEFADLGDVRISKPGVYEFSVETETKRFLATYIRMVQL